MFNSTHAVDKVCLADSPAALSRQPEHMILNTKQQQLHHSLQKDAYLIQILCLLIFLSLLSKLVPR